MGSINAARQIARRLLTDCEYLGRREDVLLVVSELVTNALVHGEGPPVLRMSGTPLRVRVEVSDGGGALPEVREPGQGSGWGMNVVKLLSAAWGISQQEPGKAVWCELEGRLSPLSPEHTST